MTYSESKPRPSVRNFRACTFSEHIPPAPPATLLTVLVAPLVRELAARKPRIALEVALPDSPCQRPQQVGSARGVFRLQHGVRPPLAVMRAGQRRRRRPSRSRRGGPSGASRIPPSCGRSRRPRGLRRRLAGRRPRRSRASETGAAGSPARAGAAPGRTRRRGRSRRRRPRSSQAYSRSCMAASISSDAAVTRPSSVRRSTSGRFTYRSSRSRRGSAASSGSTRTAARRPVTSSLIRRTVFGLAAVPAMRAPRRVRCLPGTMAARARSQGPPRPSRRLRRGRARYGRRRPGREFADVQFGAVEPVLQGAPDLLRLVGGVRVHDRNVHGCVSDLRQHVVDQHAPRAGRASSTREPAPLASVHFEEGLEVENLGGHQRRGRRAAALPGVVERVHVGVEVDAGNHGADRREHPVEVETRLDGAARRGRDQALTAAGGLGVHDLYAHVRVALAHRPGPHDGRVVGRAEHPRDGQRQHRVGLFGRGRERLRECAGGRGRGRRRLPVLTLDAVELRGRDVAPGGVLDPADVDPHRDYAKAMLPLTFRGQRRAAVDDYGNAIPGRHIVGILQYGGWIVDSEWWMVTVQSCGAARPVHCRGGFETRPRSRP